MLRIEIDFSLSKNTRLFPDREKFINCVKFELSIQNGKNWPLGLSISWYTYMYIHRYGFVSKRLGKIDIKSQHFGRPFSLDI